MNTAAKIQTISENSNIGRGGARKNAGRKRGSITKRTREIAERAMDEGITPLEYMLQVMRTEPDEELEPRELMAAQQLRFESAKACAPYMHPRLMAIEHTGQDGGAMNHAVTLQIVGVAPVATAG